MRKRWSPPILKRVKAYGPYVAARTLRKGQVSVLRGVDRLTGMPVVLYVMPGEEIPPTISGPHLLPVTDTGSHEDGTFAAVPLSLTATPATDVHQSATGALRALMSLHERGLIHGGLTPEQLWTENQEVHVAGAGLPWGRLGEEFDPPEHEKSPAGDLYTLARTLSTLGELPEALGPLLDPDPQARGTAREALERLQREPDSQGIAIDPGVGVLAGSHPGAELPSPPVASPPAQAGGTHAPTPKVVIIDAIEPEMLSPPHDPPLQHERPAPPIILDETFDEPHATPVAATRSHAERPSPRGHPLRIGWEEDHSWRVVKSVPEPAIKRPPAVPRWLLTAVVLTVIAVLGFMTAVLPADTPQECCSVQFDVRGGNNVQGRLQIVDAPAQSGLKTGDLLSKVPGQVQFPDAPGTYTLRVLADGYQPQTLQLRVPTKQPVVIEVAR